MATNDRWRDDIRVPKGAAQLMTVQQLGSGWAAVLMWMNTEEADLGPFWEPWALGNGRYATWDEAAAEARSWAQDGDIPLAEDLKV